MAKSGFWMRGTRGTVGGMTFSRGADGSTVVSVREGQKNPRTRRQMNQRALFATAVKFFKHANQSLFKFAYEDKTNKESDYNAFMRHNIKLSAIYRYEQSQNPNFPAIGKNWVLSVGSLSNPNVGYNNNWGALACPSISGNEDSWGEVSQALIKDYGLQTGDFITLVVVSAAVNSIYDEGLTEPTWDVRQYTVDPNSTMPLGDYIGRAAGKLLFADGELNPDDANGVSVVFSRITSKGLLVSTSYLVNNGVANAIYSASENETYRVQAIESWKASAAAVLQGSISQNPTVTPSPTVTSIMGLAYDPDEFDTMSYQAVGTIFAKTRNVGQDGYFRLRGTNLKSVKPSDIHLPSGMDLDDITTQTDTIIEVAFTTSAPVINGAITIDGIGIIGVCSIVQPTISNTVVEFDDTNAASTSVKSSDGVIDRSNIDEDAEVYVEGIEIPYNGHNQAVWIPKASTYVAWESSTYGRITLYTFQDYQGQVEKDITANLAITKIVYKDVTYLQA